MKLYKQIDLYFGGDYVCSTKQAKTCKDAVKKLIEAIENRKHSIAGLTLVEEQILKYPNSLTAGFYKK